MSGTNRCGEYNEILSAYLDGELSPSERVDLLQHMASCPECRAALDEYRAIGSRLRALPPVQVPESLTASVYMHTVDAPPRRLLVLTNRMAYPAAAIAAVLMVFIVAVFLLVDGYQRRIDPEIVGSSPTYDVTAWRVNEPIRITFNKEMDRESVEAALGIQPTSESRLLERTWEGNTLIIGANRLLKPGTSYRINITTEARDKWGNRLAEPFQLGFETSSNVALDSEPDVEPSPTATPEAAVIAPDPTPSDAQQLPTSDTKQPPPTSQATVREGSVETPESADPSESVSDSQDSPPQQSDTPPPPPPPADEPEAPTSTPVPPVPTEVPTDVPVELPTEVPPTTVPEPTATPEPEPTLPPAPPTSTPEPTATPDTVGVTGSFGNVFWRNESVRAGLGEPVYAAEPVGIQELDFQHGKMLQNYSTGEIIIMHTSGFWEFVPDTSSGELPEFVEVDGSGIWEPGGVFGYIWQADRYVSETLGLAVSGSSYAYDSLSQQFESGRMFYSDDGFIYVLYDNGIWELYPDAGPLSDDSSD
jgi:hypothetical protein